MATPTIVGTISHARKPNSINTSLTFSHPVISTNDVLVVLVGNSAGGSETVSATYNGTAMTIWKTIMSAVSMRLTAFFLLSPPVGTANVVITPSNGQQIAAAALNVRNFGQFHMGELISNFTQTSATDNINSQTDELVIDFLVTSGDLNAVFTQGAGQTLIYAEDSLADTALRSCMSREPGAATNTMSWTWTPAMHYALFSIALRGVGQRPSGAPTYLGPVTAAQTFSFADASELRFLHEVRSVDNMIVVMGGASNADTTITAVTFNGDALTQHTQNSSGGIFYRDNPDVGTYEVVVTISGSNRGMGVLVFSVRTTGIRDVTLQTQGTESITVDSLAGDLCIDYTRLTDTFGLSGTPGAGQTVLYQQPVVGSGTGYSGGPSSYQTAVGTSTTFTWTLSPDGTSQQLAISLGPLAVPDAGEQTLGTDGLIEMCFHRGTSFRTWIKYRGLGDVLVARRFWWLGDVQSLKATDDINEIPQQGATGTYEELPEKVYGLIPEYGLATWFNGTTQRVSTLTGLSNTGGQFTLIALVRPDAAGLGSAQCIYQTGAVGSAYLGINASDQPVFGVNGGTVITSGLTLEADHNYLLVATYDGSEGSLFAAECVITAMIDEVGPTALTFTAEHFIGTIGSNENTEYFTGAIQHVAELEDVLDLEDVEGLHSTTYWTDVTPDVEGLLTSDIGIHDDSPLARIAATGQLRLTMDNSVLNSAGLEGYYSPDHANVREGFQRGIPIRFSLFDEGSPNERIVQFIGTIRSIRPTPGIYLERRSIVLATDWIDEAARSTLRALEVQTNVTADQVVGHILNSMRNRPHAIALQTGTDTYPIALHNTTDEQTTAQAELLKVAQTELGLIYVRSDGTLVLESRRTRSQATTLDYTLTNFLTVDQDDAADQAKNLIKVTAHPSRVGDDPVAVLYSNDATGSPADPAIQLDNGVNLEIFLPFRDLGGEETVRIGATEIVDPVATTDYLINTTEDGSGTNVTGNTLITLEFSLGGNGVYLRANNQYGQRVWITFLQVRGRAVYDFEPVTAIAKNQNNIDEIGQQELALDMPYQSQPGIAQGAADFLLNSLRERQTRLRSVTFWGDYSDDHKQALLRGGISTRIHASELMSGISGEYFVNAKRIEWKPSGDSGLRDIDVTFHVAGVNEVGSFWVLDESALDETTRLAYL